MKLCGTDLRSPPAWSRSQRKRIFDRAVVSNLWTYSPFGNTPTEVFPHVQPGVWMNRDAIVGEIGTFNREFGEWCVHNDVFLRNALGQIVTIRWPESTAERVQVVNLTVPEVRNRWVDDLVNHFSWASGIFHDYFCDLLWMDPALGPGFTAPWFEAWRQVVDRERSYHPDWKILGQEWHGTPITGAVDGVFVERIDEFYPVSRDALVLDMKKHGKPDEWMLELRRPWVFPGEYVAEFERLCEDMGCFGSFGRDLTARARA